MLRVYPSWTLDKSFYLISNPDLLNSNLSSKDHFLQYRNSEDRIFQKKVCTKRIIETGSHEYKKILGLLVESNLILRKRVKLICFELPWHLGSYGYPTRIYEVKLLQFKIFQTRIFNQKFTGLVFKRFFQKRLYFFLNEK
jgi:hypothetical protein